MDLEEELKYDKFKTRILEDILLRKKTEAEVRKKYSRYDDSEKYLDRAIEDIKYYGYIDDLEYAKLYIEDAINLKKKNSIMELKMKLKQKGVSDNNIQEAIYDNYDKLDMFEQETIMRIIDSKKNMEEDKLVKYLYRKGFKRDNIQNAILDYKYENDCESED